MTSIRDGDAGSGSGALSSLCEHELLARRNDELEMVLSTAGIGYCCVDPGRRLTDADPHFNLMFGWPPDAAPTWSDLQRSTAQDDWQLFARAIQSAFDEGILINLVLRTAWSDGEPRWVSLRGCATADAEGVRSRVLLTARDVTEERVAAAALESAIAAERRLRLAAEAANRSKDEFLSVISHELRSPLNAILGWNQILAIKRGSDAEVAAVAPRIERSARAQLKMVNDLLDFGRIGTGKLRITPRRMTLGPIVAASVDAVRPEATVKGIELVTDLVRLSGMISGDPDRLTQVAGNLLSNAVKFTPAGGRITVRLREAAGRAELSVIDTGRGIAADLLPHIFDRFQQGDSSTTRRDGGLGLGLTLVREIVSLHGGTVAAASGGLDRGSTFVVRLPIAGAGSSTTLDGCPRVQRSAGRQQLAGLSVLVVDDEADARSVVAEALRLDGARVTPVGSAREALAQLLACGASFDCVVTDIGMPGEDGYSLVRKLRALESRKHVIAIALTGYATHGDVVEAIDAGFDLHIPKPVDFDSFVPIIRRLAKLN